MTDKAEYIWLFHGQGGRTVSAAFSTRENADKWIRANRLTGLLTRYPIDVSCYDYAINKGHFTPKHERQKTPVFIQSFSTGEVHEHYLDGRPS